MGTEGSHVTVAKLQKWCLGIVILSLLFLEKLKFSQDKWSSRWVVASCHIL
jgi:hypothetical protein